MHRYWNRKPTASTCAAARFDVVDDDDDRVEMANGNLSRVLTCVNGVFAVRDAGNASEIIRRTGSPFRSPMMIASWVCASG